MDNQNGGAPTRPTSLPEAGGAQTTYIPPSIQPEGPRGGEQPRNWTASSPRQPNWSSQSRRTNRGHRGYGRNWTGKPQDMTGPVILILVGSIFLLSNFGFLAGNVWSQIWRLWPLILVGIGLNIVLGPRVPWASTAIWLGVMVIGAVLLVGTGSGVSGNWGGILIFALLALVIAGIAVWGGMRGVSSTSAGETSALRATGGSTMSADGNSSLLQSNLSVPLSGAASANVRVDFGAGELNLTGGASSPTELASGLFRFNEGWGEPAYATSVANGVVDLHINQKSPGSPPWPNFPRFEGPRWELRLNRQVPMGLTVKTGASKANLDLESLRVSHLELDLGASDTTLTFPASAGQTTSHIAGGAMNLMLYIPANVAARIQTKAGLASINVDPCYRRVDAGYISDNYDTEVNRLDLVVEVGMSSVTIRSKGA
ncbi:MAG: DUF5668 domain-containing protein [Chloroflexota bacterium]